MVRHDSRRALPDALHAAIPVVVDGPAPPRRTAFRERLDRDGRLAVRMIGVAYLILWGLTWWSLDHGAAVLTHHGACRLEPLSDLFVWRCLPQAPLPVVADLLNGVLAGTLWAPAVVLAAVSQPDVRLVAAVLVGLHLIGLPAALLVAIRAGARVCDGVVRGWTRRGQVRRGQPPADRAAEPEHAPAKWTSVRRRECDHARTSGAESAPAAAEPAVAASMSAPPSAPGSVTSAPAPALPPARPGADGRGPVPGPVAALRRLAGIAPAVPTASLPAASRTAAGSGAADRRRSSAGRPAGPPVLPRSTFGLRRTAPI